jgi:hypothetical protein
MGKEIYVEAFVRNRRYDLWRAVYGDLASDIHNRSRISGNGNNIR